MLHGATMSFLQSLDEKGIIDFHSIRWDWRRTFEESEQYISSELEKICSQAASKKVVLMTHSTGAVVSWPTINQHPEWFDTWINVAGAVAGTSVLLKDFQHHWNDPGIESLNMDSFVSFLMSHFLVIMNQS